MTPSSDRNAALLGWYAANRRDLPWRDVGDAYAVLVSEIMLQQTQVGRVIPYYERFMERFPTIEDLAGAPLGDVLAAWSGLGYNARAKRLHDAAKSIASAGWPASLDELESLPGVGAYTARAVGAFALGMEAVPVDANLRRVLSRWHGEQLSGPALQAIADRDASGTVTADWSQAVMDLGAQLCRPRRPGCDVCPVTEWCAGPDVYAAPRAQPRFEGSARQLRGALIRRLVSGPAGVPTLAADTGFPAGSVGEALSDLEAEGLVEAAGSVFRLPE